MKISYLFVSLSFVFFANPAFTQVGFADSSSVSSSEEIDLWGEGADVPLLSKAELEEETGDRIVHKDHESQIMEVKGPDPKHEIKFISESEYQQKKRRKHERNWKQATVPATMTTTCGGIAVLSAALGIGTAATIAGTAGLAALPLATGGLIYGGYKLYKHAKKDHILLTSEERKLLTEEVNKNKDDAKKTVHLVVERLLDNLCVANGFAGGVSELTVEKEKKATLSSLLKKEKYLFAHNDQGGIQKYPTFPGYPHILLYKKVVCRGSILDLSKKDSQSSRISEYVRFLRKKVENEKDPDEGSIRKEFDDFESDMKLHPDKYAACSSQSK